MIPKSTQQQEDEELVYAIDELDEDTPVEGYPPQRRDFRVAPSVKRASPGPRIDVPWKLRRDPRYLGYR